MTFLENPCCNIETFERCPSIQTPKITQNFLTWIYIWRWRLSLSLCVIRNRIKIAIRVFKWQHLLVCTYRLIITSLLCRVERIKYLQFSQLLICCRRRICNNIAHWLMLFSRRCYSAFGKRVDPSYIISQHVTYSVEVEQSDQATSVESRTIFHGRIIHERLIKYFKVEVTAH